MKRNYYVTIFGLLIIGCCIGLLTGLSVSPVIQTIISTILTFVISALAILCGVHETDKTKYRLLKSNIDIVPIGCLVLGLTFGCLGGIFVRTHSLLSLKEPIPPSKEEKKVKVEFDQSKATVLYAQDVQVCDIINGYTGTVLVDQLRALGIVRINKIIDSLGEKNPEKIKKELNKLCE